LLLVFPASTNVRLRGCGRLMPAFVAAWSKMVQPLCRMAGMHGAQDANVSAIQL